MQVRGFDSHHICDGKDSKFSSQRQCHDLPDPVQKRRFWGRHLEQCRQSPLTQKAYCQEHGLKRHQFYYWKKRLTSAPEKVSFLPVNLGMESFGYVKSASGSGRVLRNPSTCAVRILIPNGVAVELEGPVNIADLLSMAAKL